MLFKQKDYYPEQLDEINYFLSNDNEIYNTFYMNNLYLYVYITTCS